MEWDVQFDDDFGTWFDGLTEALQDEIIALTNLLREHGPQLGRPYVDTLEDSAFTNMKELRVQFRGASCSRSTPAARRFYWLVATSGATSDGTRSTCQSPTSASGGIWSIWKSEEIMPIRLDDYLAKLPKERQEAIKKRTAELIAEEASLRQVREARERTQEELAKKLHVNQAAVSKLERRADMYLSTLRRYIEAMGGELEIVARFPDKVVRITQFATLDPENQPQREECDGSASKGETGAVNVASTH